MKTGQVMQQFGIKRDTLRFYTEQGLLQPQLINGNYFWSAEEINNLENILGLRQLGLSVKAIIRIKELHDTKCGSLEQLKENKQVILDEIADREKQILLLQEQKENLENLLQQIEEKCKRPITRYIEKAPKSCRLWNLFLFTSSLNIFIPWQIG
ncbi:MerR family transcriptional regulator, partial [Streptococcus suis]